MVHSTHGAEAQKLGHWPRFDMTNWTRLDQYVRRELALLNDPAKLPIELKVLIARDGIPTFMVQHEAHQPADAVSLSS